MRSRSPAALRRSRAVPGAIALGLSFLWVSAIPLGSFGVSALGGAYLLTVAHTVPSETRGERSSQGQLEPLVSA